MMFIPKKTFEDLREAMQILIDVHKKSVAKLNELDKRVKALERDNYTISIDYGRGDDFSALDYSRIDLASGKNGMVRGEKIVFGRN